MNYRIRYVKGGQIALIAPDGQIAAARPRMGEGAYTSDEEPQGDDLVIAELLAIIPAGCGLVATHPGDITAYAHEHHARIAGWEHKRTGRYPGPENSYFGCK